MYSKKKKGWSYKQVISLSHLNNAIFFYLISDSSFHPFLPWRVDKHTSVQLAKTIQITETGLLCIFNKFWDTNL